MLTPTQLVHQAAIKTPIVPVAMEKQVEYADVETVDVDDERCWLCGGETAGKGQPKKKAIKPTFTNHDNAACKESLSVCENCVFCLSYRSLRNYNILATKEGLMHPGRAETRDLLLEPPQPPFLFCVATSGQKWLHFKGEVAYSRNNFPVQYEEMKVYVERPIFAYILEHAERLYTVFSKAEILSGDYTQNRIKQIGLSEFQELEQGLAPYRGSRLFDLAVFVSQKQEAPDTMPEQKKEETKCIITSTPGTEMRQLRLF